MKLEKLTAEQESQMISYREECRSFGLSTERVDKPKTIESITRMYELIGKPAPKFIFCPSLMFAQFQIAYCEELFKLLDTDNLWDNLRANLWDNLRANLGANLRANLGDNLRDNGFRGTDFWGGMDMYWIAFYEFPEKFLGVKYSPSDSEKLSLWSQIGKSSSWFWAYENYCFVSDRPEYIHMNDAKRLHNTEGSAIKWSDGYEIYYIDGREISNKNFHSIKNKSYTVEEFMSEKNEEVKSVCIQMMIDCYGDNYVSSFLSPILKEIDTYVDKKDSKFLEGTTGSMTIGVYTLFIGNMNGFEISYVRCYCPSTDRMFYLGVEPVYKNAKDAIASLYTIPEKLKDHIKSISRQGERFSTIFDDKGLEMIKSGASLGDPVSISGDEYFEKMQYEF